MALFSIITVTLNNLAGLQKTQQSVAGQTCGDYEWLVQDGGSSDGTQEYLQSLDYANVVSAPDDGLYDAMNIGLARAKGTYVMFLNAGDELAAPDTLEVVAKEAKDDSDFIYGDAYEQASDGPRFLKKARSHTKIAYGLITHHQAMLYKRKKITDMTYNMSYKIAADFDFTARCLKNKNLRILYIPTPLIVFESGGVSQKNAALGRREEFSVKMQYDLCSPLQARLIMLRQICALWLYRYCNSLYRILRS